MEMASPTYTHGSGHHTRPTRHQHKRTSAEWPTNYGPTGAADVMREAEEPPSEYRYKLTGPLTEALSPAPQASDSSDRESFPNMGAESDGSAYTPAGASHPADQHSAQRRPSSVRSWGSNSQAPSSVVQLVQGMATHEVNALVRTACTVQQHRTGTTRRPCCQLHLSRKAKDALDMSGSVLMYRVCYVVW